MQKLLIVEDDRELNKALCYALKKENYRTDSAFTIREAKALYEKEEPIFILLDVNLPDGEGFAFCRWVKRKKDIPILFLTARDLEEDALAGYESGAVDYVTKPFSIKILLRKIEVILKHMNNVQNLIFDDGRLRIDLDQAKVSIGKKEINLTPTEFRLLKKLVTNKGILLTYDVLSEYLWETGGQSADRHTLAVNINRLRGKIEDPQHSYITNIYGMGYQWIGA